MTLYRIIRFAAAWLIFNGGIIGAGLVMAHHEPSALSALAVANILVATAIGVGMSLSAALDR
jgi:hypothetical protein